MRLPRLLTAVALGAGLLAAGAALPTGHERAVAATAKPTNACGLKALPLAIGNSWTFIAAAPPQEATPQQKQFLPPQPKQVVITVADIKPGVDKKAGLTTVSLTEDVDGHIINSTITCTANGATFTISPDSMLYAGEPGGWSGLEFPTWTSSGPTWATAAGKFLPEWREDVKATWKRIDADKSSGTLEIEHAFTVEEPESIGTSAGTFLAHKLIVEVTGRVGIDKPVKADKPMELPANWINALWLADDVGPVQILNSYAHLYSLKTLKLAQ